MSNSTIQPNVNKQEWELAADNAKEALASVGAMASQVASDVGKKADELTASAGVGIQELGNRLSKNAPQSGVLGTATQAVAKTIKDSGEYVEGAKLSGMTEDVAEVIRRNPIPSILIAIGLGWFLGRKLKG